MLTIYEEDVNIETENPGVLEVPEGKNVEDLPIKHFVALANKKGLSTITRALNNLQVWNKNKNKPLSKWAGDMIDKVSKRFENQKKNESLNHMKEDVYDSIVNLPEKEFIDQLALNISTCYDPTAQRIIVHKLEKGRKNAIDGLEYLLPSYKIRDIMDTIHQRSETISTTNDPYEFENYFYDKVMDKTLDYVIENEKVSRQYHITTESANKNINLQDKSLINEFSSNFNGTEFGEVEFYSDDLYKWKNEDSIINAIEAHSPIDINVYGVEFEPSHNLVITYEVRAEDYDEDRIEAIVIDSLERLEDKIRDAKPKYLENIHSYDYAEKDTIANNISEWVFDGDVDTNLEELESLVGDLDFEAYADPDTLHDFLMSFTLDVLLYVESELNV